MRPFYETEEDRAALNAIVARLQQLFGGKFSPVPSGLNFKRFRTDGRLEDCWIVKRRHYMSEQLDDLGGYMLALRKWEAGYQCSLEHDCQFSIALQLEDGLFLATFAWPEMRKEQFDFEVRTGGRTDRADPEDIEECIYIPMWRFQKEAD